MEFKVATQSNGAEQHLIVWCGIQLEASQSAPLICQSRPSQPPHAYSSTITGTNVNSVTHTRYFGAIHHGLHACLLSPPNVTRAVIG